MESVATILDTVVREVHCLSYMTGKQGLNLVFYFPTYTDIIFINNS